MSTANKLTYLNGTKQAIKQAINEDFEVIDDNTTFREYAEEISSNNAKYKDLIPKETKNATNTLDISNSSGLDKALVTQYGNTYQETTTGKNKLSPNLKPNGDRGIIGTYNNSTGEITITGTPTAVFSNVGDRVDFATPLPAGTYTLSTEKVENVRIGLHLYKSGGDINNYAIALGNKELQITVTDEITGYYLYIYGLDSTKQYNQSFKAMFESGSSATDWEKYTGGNPAPNPDYPQTISNVTGTNTINVIGKNLFDKDNANTINLYINNSTSKLVTTTEGTGCLYIPCEANTTYTVSKTELFGNDRFCVFDTARVPTAGDTVLSFVGSRSGADTHTSYTITTTATATYLGVFVKAGTNPSKTMQEIAETIQVEKGTTATTYEAYKEKSYTINLGSIELCKIEDYKDRIYYSSGKWYLEKNINKVVLDGSESGWGNDGGNAPYSIYKGDMFRKNDLSVVLSNKFMGVSYSSNWNLYNYLITTKTTANQRPSIKIKYDTNALTLDEFKNWLSTHNTIVYYILATPTTEEITESNYPTLYNQLNNIKLFEGVNHITMTNESGLDVEFDIEYYKDWKLD